MRPPSPACSSPPRPWWPRSPRRRRCRCRAAAAWAGTWTSSPLTTPETREGARLSRAPSSFEDSGRGTLDLGSRFLIRPLRPRDREQVHADHHDQRPEGAGRVVEQAEPPRLPPPRTDGKARRPRNDPQPHGEGADQHAGPQDECIRPRPDGAGPQHLEDGEHEEEHPERDVLLEVFAGDHEVDDAGPHRGEGERRPKRGVRHVEPPGFGGRLHRDYGPGSREDAPWVGDPHRPTGYIHRSEMVWVEMSRPSRILGSPWTDRVKAPTRPTLYSEPLDPPRTGAGASSWSGSASRERRSRPRAGPATGSPRSIARASGPSVTTFEPRRRTSPCWGRRRAATPGSGIGWSTPSTGRRTSCWASPSWPSPWPWSRAVVRRSGWCWAPSWICPSTRSGAAARGARVVGWA